MVLQVHKGHVEGKVANGAMVDDSTIGDGFLGTQGGKFLCSARISPLIRLFFFMVIVRVHNTNCGPKSYKFKLLEKLLVQHDIKVLSDGRSCVQTS